MQLHDGVATSNSPNTALGSVLFLIKIAECSPVVGSPTHMSHGQDVSQKSVARNTSNLFQSAF